MVGADLGYLGPAQINCATFVAANYCRLRKIGALLEPCAKLSGSCNFALLNRSFLDWNGAIGVIPVTMSDKNQISVIGNRCLSSLILEMGRILRVADPRIYVNYSLGVLVPKHNFETSMAEPLDLCICYLLYYFCHIPQN